MWHADNADCPLGKYAGISPTPRKKPQPQPNLIDVEGPKLWAKFHPWTLSEDPNPAKWLAEFREQLRVASLGCTCLAEWDKWLAEHPVPSERDARFAWGVDAHNAVNVRKGKPRMMVAEALKRWN